MGDVSMSQAVNIMSLLVDLAGVFPSATVEVHNAGTIKVNGDEVTFCQKPQVFKVGLKTIRAERPELPMPEAEIENRKFDKRRHRWVIEQQRPKGEKR